MRRRNLTPPKKPKPPQYTARLQHYLVSELETEGPDFDQGFEVFWAMDDLTQRGAPVRWRALSEGEVNALDAYLQKQRAVTSKTLGQEEGDDSQQAQKESEK